MNVKFTHLYIENFMSFSHADFNLDGRGYVLVQGVNHNPTDCAESNGSGKSSIWDVEALTIL